MRVISLSSGSRGNAYLIGEGAAWLLIDDGLPLKTLRARVAAVFGTEVPDVLAAVSGLLVTHSHGDHTNGIKPLLAAYDMTVYANSMTADAIVGDQGVDSEAFLCFENGQDFEVGPFAIHPFSIPHDTSDPVGYCVSYGGETYFHGTDIGTPLDSIGVQLARADVATLESNHDSVMLHTSGRAPSLIQRIAGPRGHLSNDESCSLIRKFATSRLRRLGLAHLSHDCNAPHVALSAMTGQLTRMRRTDVVCKVFVQDEPVEL